MRMVIQERLVTQDRLAKCKKYKRKMECEDDEEWSRLRKTRQSIVTWLAMNIAASPKYSSGLPWIGSDDRSPNDTTPIPGLGLVSSSHWRKQNGLNPSGTSPLGTSST
ncbi:hypothetical protein Tco_1236211 [Tanacetum coccineum]